MTVKKRYKLHFNKMKILLSLISSFVSFVLFAQAKSTPFPIIDKRVKSIQSGDPDTLMKLLTKPYNTDIEKTRSIFRWITENIAYDTKGYHNPERIYEGLWELSLSSGAQDIKKDYNDRIVRKVLKEKKAVCDGYSRIFKTLCDYAQIKCEIISGYIRWASDPIGIMTNRTHSWNAVFIEAAWRLIDVTWASGYSNDDVTEFKKRYDDFFFFTNPVEFFNDHYPVESKWSLLPNTPSLDQFYNFPFYYPDFYRFKITSVKPTAGHINVTPTNKSVLIELVTKEKSKNMYLYEKPFSLSENDTVNLDSLSEEEITKLYEPKYKLDNGRITYLYEIKSDKAEKLNVVYNDKLILSYGIRFKK